MSLWKAAHDTLLAYLDALERKLPPPVCDLRWNKYTEARDAAVEATS